jgi:hypothetical protein
MAEKRVELKEEMLDNVLGGVAYDTEHNIIGVDKDHMIYHFDDIDACLDWVRERVDTFTGPTRHQDIIDGLLAAGLIY